MAHDPDVLEYHAREIWFPGAVAMALLPTYLGLTGLWSSAKALLGVHDAYGNAWRADQIAVGFVASIMLLLMGLTCVWLRRTGRIDKRAQTVTTWWGKGLPLFKKTYPLSQFGLVWTEKRAVKRGYLHLISLSGNGKAVRVAEARSEERANGIINELCAFTGLPR